MKKTNEKGRAGLRFLVVVSLFGLLAVVLSATRADIQPTEEATSIEASSDLIVLTNLSQLAEEAFSVNHSLYLPWTPWEWQAFSTDGGKPWFLDCSQLPCLSLLPASTNLTTGLQAHGVQIAGARLTKSVLTGETTLQPDGSTDVVVRIPAPSDYQPGALAEDRSVWISWQEATNCPDCWGIEGEIPTPTVELHVMLADAADYAMYQSHIVAEEAEAEAQFEAMAAVGRASRLAAATTASETLAPPEEAAGEGGGEMLLMGGDPCDSNQTFAISSIRGETTNRWVTITWPACPTNFLYEVQASPALNSSTVWTSQVLLVSTGSWTDTNAPVYPSRFYRVRRLATDGDFDDDGMLDDWEIANGLDPLLDDAAADADGDGYTNLKEYECGTNPRNSNSYPDPAVNVVAPWSVWAGTSGLTASVLPFFTTLHQFANDEGQAPKGELVQGSDGNLYGTTPYGGTNGKGIVFKVDPSGTFTTLVSFAEGAQPQGALVEGNDGYFYGTTYGGGTNNSGTVFKMSPSGTLTTLYQFNSTTITNGFYPQAGLVQGNDGCFYGTTYAGGINWNGTVFKITSAGTLTSLHKFSAGAEGYQPYAGLVLGSDGDFYGTTSSGGTNNNGTVFKISSAGTLTTLYRFSGGADGRWPQAGLTQGSDGSFYGTTIYGGTNANGTVFKITSAGTLTTLHKFTGGMDGATPYAGLVRGAGGDCYGTTYVGGAFGNGTVFRISSAGTLTVLHHFNYNTEGASPMRGLLQTTDGAFYGTTSFEPPNFQGTLFKLSKSPASFSWSVTNGTITAGQGTTNITWTAADDTNTATVCVTVPSGTNCDVTRCINVIINRADFDNDGDGLSDGDEANLYHTDPNYADSDHDGMPDGWELAYGLNPLSSSDAASDPDADGWKNLEEYTNGTNPTQADPPPDMIVNGGQPYTPTLTVVIQPLSTNYPKIRVSASAWMTNVAVLANTGSISYTLPDQGDGLYHLYLQYADAAGQPKSTTLGKIVTLDRVEPQVGIISPASGTVLDQAFITLQAVAADPDTMLPAAANRPLSVWINDEPFWERAGTNLNFERFPVPKGTNSFTVTIRAADAAGHTNQASLTWTVDTSGDIVAPQMSSFNIVTNMLLPDVSEVWMEGAVDDANAIVSAVVNSDAGATTNSMKVRGQKMEGLVSLEFGTNTVAMSASDAAGNVTNNVFMIIRSDRFRAAITNPVFGAFANAPSNFVSGYVSAKFDEGLSTETNVTSVTINGVTAVLSTNTDASGNLQFTSAQKIPLGVPITGTIGGPGIPADPPPSIPPAMSQEYEVTHKEMFGENYAPGEGSSGKLDRDLGTVCWYSDMSLSLGWSVDDVPSGAADVQIQQTSQFGGLFYYEPICVLSLNPDEVPWYMDAPWTYSTTMTGPDSRALAFGLSSYKHGRGAGSDTVWDFEHLNPCEYVTYYYETAYLERHRADGWIRFRAPRQYDTNTTVVFTFEGMDYKRRSGAPLDLSQIKFRGQAPLTYSNQIKTVSYLLTVDGDKEYTITQDDFTWPADQQPGHTASSYVNPADCVIYKANSFAGWWVEDMHRLSWTNFHNAVVQLRSDKAIKSPVVFSFGTVDLGNPCDAQSNAPALVIYYKDVVNQDFEVQPFTVFMEVTDTKLPNPLWTKHAGPDSGVLSNATGTTASFLNPTNGGLYRFDLALGGQTTRTQLLLPLAGADIATWLDSEIKAIPAWAQQYKAAVVAANASYNWALRKHRIYRVWCAVSAELFDYDLDAVDASGRGACKEYNRKLNGDPAPIYDFVTVNGTVVHGSKIVNMLWGAFGRAWGYTTEELRAGAHVNELDQSHWTRLDPQSSQNAIEIGSGLYTLVQVDPNADIKAALTTQQVLRMRQDDDMLFEQGLWPGEEADLNQSHLSRPNNLPTTP